MRSFPAIVLMFLSLHFFSQAAIYLNASDFLNNRPSCESEHAYVKTHELVNRKTISLKCHDSIFMFKKSEIYGFKNGTSYYRIINGQILSILNPGEEIILYKYSSGSGLKNSPLIERYYISKTTESAPIELNLQNIYLLFAENKNFSMLVELYFKSNEELVQYDSIHHLYKLNRLYQLSKNLK